MIEKVILDYLNENSEVSAYTEKPLTVPDKYILIEKTGGSENDFLYTATVAVQSYADSLYNAAQLNDAVVQLMLEMPDTVEKVSQVTLNSEYNYTDTTKKKYRYQAVFDIFYFR